MGNASAVLGSVIMRLPILPAVYADFQELEGIALTSIKAASGCPASPSGQSGVCDYVQWTASLP